VRRSATGHRGALPYVAGCLLLLAPRLVPASEGAALDRSSSMFSFLSN
jgi:hypothetical protein